MLKADKLGRVFFTAHAMSPSEVRDRLFLGNTDKGSYVVQFELDEGIPFENSAEHPYEMITRFGNLRNGRQINIHRIGPNNFE